MNNIVFGRNDNKLFRYDVSGLRLQEYPIGKNMQDALKIKITPDYLYVLRPDKLEVYSYRK